MFGVEQMYERVQGRFGIMMNFLRDGRVFFEECAKRFVSFGKKVTFVWLL